MPTFFPRQFNVGDVLTAKMLNEIIGAVRELQNIRVSGGLTFRRGAGGYQLATTAVGVTRLHWSRIPSGGVAAATGTWPSLAASSFTADVYAGDGGDLSLVAEGVTVYWRYMDGADEGKIVPCMDNGDGTYDAILDSCTAVGLDA